MAVLHVAGAVFLVGPMALLPMTGLRAVRNGDANGVLALARSTSIYSLLSLLVVIFGFGAMGTSSYDISFGEVWIWLSLLLWLVALGINFGVVVPRLRQAAAGLRQAAQVSAPAEGAAVSERAAADYPRLAMSSGVVSLLLLAVVVLMVVKP